VERIFRATNIEQGVILLKLSTRRRSALTAVVGLFMAGAVVGVSSQAAQAAPGTLGTTNACISNATATYSDLVWTLTGTATPASATLGTDNVTLTNASVQVNVPATLLIAGYNLGLLVTGPNAIPVTVFVARSATNVDTGGGVKGTLVKKDNFVATVNTVIADPDGTAGTGDETATPLAINQPLADWVVTPLGGNVVFSQAAPGSLGSVPGVGAGGAAVAAAGSMYASASVAGGLVKANFDCSPGTTIIDPPGGTSGTTFTPAASIGAFENATVVAPPTAPVCDPESVSVGVGQTATIDLNNNCTDVNESQGGGSPFTFTVGTPSAGTLDPTAAPGVYTYTAPATDPGAAVIIGFTATDQTALTSASADVTITVLANQCDATAASCDLTQIVVQPVVGATMTMDKVPGIVPMSAVVLNGAEQVSTGALNTITVTNARGSAAAWSVTAYATDLGAAGAPTFTPLPGVTVALCSLAGAGPFAANPAFAATITSDRLCIPGDNLGWSPAAGVAHNDIPGDVAQVTAGAASAADPAAWLAALVAAGNTADPAQGVDGLGGLLGAKTLCSAPVNHSGGTFTCNASLYLGVPASAGAGTYTGGIVLTLA
jgi:hypothetical protein